MDVTAGLTIFRGDKKDRQKTGSLILLYISLTLPKCSQIYIGGLGNYAKRDPESFDREIRSLLGGAGSGPGPVFKGTPVVSLPEQGESCLGDCSPAQR